MHIIVIKIFSVMQFIKLILKAIPCLLSSLLAGHCNNYVEKSYAVNIAIFIPGHTPMASLFICYGQFIDPAAV